MFPSVAALSYSWLCFDHPDPEGYQAERLCEVLKAIMAWRAKMGRDPDFMIFIDFHSLYQGLPKPKQDDRTTEQMDVFKIALGNMDIVYAHAGTLVLMQKKIMPRAKCNQHGPCKLRGDYNGRGWTFTEKHWSCICKHGTLAWNIENFVLSDELCNAPARLFRTECKGDLAGLAMPSSYGDGSMYFADDLPLAPLIQGAREPPVPPEVFEEMLATKEFAVESDRAVVATLFKQVTITVLGDIVIGNFGMVAWSTKQLEELASSLPLCHKLTTLKLSLCKMSGEGLKVFAMSLTQDAAPVLGDLQLLGNAFEGEEGGAGLGALGAALSRGVFAKLTDVFEIGSRKEVMRMATAEQHVNQWFAQRNQELEQVLGSLFNWTGTRS